MTKFKIQKIVCRLRNPFRLPFTALRDEQRNRNTPDGEKLKFILLFGFCALALFCALSFYICHSVAYAEELKAKAPEALTKCICEGKSGQLICLDELKDPYFKDNKYNDFIGLLKGLCPGNKEVESAINYYVALARYSQLRYLEDAKSWDEYFAQGNDYRDDIVNYAQKAIAATTSKDAVNIYSRLLLYQFHKDQQDTFSDSALAELMSAVTGYAQSSDDMKTIKEAADKLVSYNENGKARELYKIYAQKLAGSSIKDAQLKDIAVSFYKDANLELAENIYDIYIERISKGLSKEKLARELTGIARSFAFGGDNNGTGDALYAEKIFRKIEELGGKKYFDEELMYLRAFNLEKAKDFAKAKDVYVEFLGAFPKSVHTDEVSYKTGIIFIYALRDLKSGRAYLEELFRKDAHSPYLLSSLYQLGLLKQWEGEPAQAQEYYNLLLKKIGNTDPDGLIVIQERLNEMAQDKPLEYNLRIGLDTALKEEFANLDMSKISLKSSSYLPEKDKGINISATANLGPTGCFQVELQYLWSGDLGLAKPAISQSEFQVSYKNPGTKLINLVLVSPEGITERAIDLVDVR